ncbi:uncharacterized protein LY79DRAFT_672921 [Colletotrichum navitas]|uniref:Uncharacterized protein n=1 Tax=Colletotrichum navitas TaxID=681940 RepID=A0AAD8PRQ4_9PEZI|nr:uncharacterized protein LY79DRAFT_672921 [Colletotrichum navitas]KAK1574459.1 hypothetical protein LY79DRAFT_672921 [Colletotrichum navitas]
MPGLGRWRSSINTMSESARNNISREDEEVGPLWSSLARVLGDSEKAVVLHPQVDFTPRIGVEQDSSLNSDMDIAADAACSIELVVYSRSLAQASRYFNALVFRKLAGYRSMSPTPGGSPLNSKVARSPHGHGSCGDKWLLAWIAWMIGAATLFGNLAMHLARSWQAAGGRLDDEGGLVNVERFPAEGDELDDAGFTDEVLFWGKANSY